ncbi:MAG: UDP-N-acetylmuramate dehydrogenase [Armatimonadetes bacterium]|nr:UDP-N-acetylmuramate dehydrogenase [Armatimonadota bacterium]
MIVTTVDDSLVKDLESVGELWVRRDVPMAAHTSLGVGGPAELYVEPATPGALAAALRLLGDAGVPTVVLGRGTNVIVSDAGVRGAVIATHPGLQKLSLAGSRVVAASGALVGTLVHLAADAGLSGVEGLAGIPGTLGGALYMNAGANGTCLADVVETVTVLCPDGSVQSLRRDEITFGYRFSSLRAQRLYVLEASLRLSTSDPARVHKRMYEVVTTRCQKQPLSARSAGSIFKRPPGDYAGRLLEAAGAKGRRIGDAQFSTKHANFIINLGRAAAADVVKLMAWAQQSVYEQFGVWLEPEVCMIGEGMEVLGRQDCAAR